jgi:hypothetical protein
LRTTSCCSESISFRRTVFLSRGGNTSSSGFWQNQIRWAVLLVTVDVLKQSIIFWTSFISWKWWKM